MQLSHVIFKMLFHSDRRLSKYNCWVHIKKIFQVICNGTHFSMKYLKYKKLNNLINLIE